MNIIPQLVEAFQHGNLALFLGADLPLEATGLPGRADLAARLARRVGLGGAPPPWPDVAAQYEASAGLAALISWLRDQLEPTKHRPGPLYWLLAQLPVTIYVTTAYDTGLYDALRETGRRPNLPVVDASSLGLLDIGRPTVVHLFGVYDRPDSLVLTRAQIRQLPHAKAQILAGLVHPTLANKHVLVLGQDLRDTYFGQMYQTALFQAGTIRPRAFASCPGMAEWEKQTWLEQGVQVIETPALDLLAGLLGRPEAEAFVSPAAEAVTTVASPPVRPADSLLDAMRDLLLAAFTADDLRRLVLYTSNPAIRPLLNEFSPGDGLATMVEKTIIYCQKRDLLPALLDEAKRANPNQYARFAPRLRV